MRWRSSLLAGLCALASFDARADPYAQAFGAFFLAVGAGFAACIVVELACGRGPWFQRAAIGVGFALVNGLLYLLFIRILITVSVASGPSASSSGPLPLVLTALAAWVIPAARLWWLKRSLPPTSP